MQQQTDGTHSTKLISWVESANSDHTDFPIQNLPYGSFRRRGAKQAEGAAIGVAIGECVLDVGSLATAGLLSGLSAATERAARLPVLNRLAALSKSERVALRARISRLLSDAGERAVVEPHLHPMEEVEMLLPFEVGDYTDFYASIEHATNVGSLFRPDNPLLPNYRWVPIGYHGRASSVIVSGTDVRRPLGQRKAPDAEAPSFGPCRMLDYELEVGCWIAGANPLGEPTPIAEAEDRIFGLSLVNDWSARDIQAWEYQPLGPFLAKSFATTTSPWVVTAEALAPFRCAMRQRGEDEPEPLEYLSHADGARPAFDIELEVLISSRAMREAGGDPVRLSATNFRHMYWSFGQMIAHHSSNGCDLRPGDLLASGTVSGESRDQFGALLEITRRGAEPIELPGGETRAMLEDGDEITLRGRCRREGVRSIGFGSARGTVLPARA
ncbi:MAG: fumarylacetoacetase [Acidobacteria bacterium]|nr:MAG: fumarylacetoacetase [Acidobacteriota bacterium]REK00324.1 MAG: fumarylacetoacetase [Acidobacteriota bacterium]